MIDLNDTAPQRRVLPDDRDDIDRALRDQVEALVTSLRGQHPNKALSTDVHLRYGAKGSLHVVVAGKDKGRITDFEAGGEKGMGPIDFIMAEMMVPVGEALRWARDWLGMQPPPPPRPVVEDEGEPTDTSAWARQQWSEAVDPTGTVAERYLVEHRGISRNTVSHLIALDAIRFHPGHRASDKPGARPWPALLVKATDAAGELQAIQAIRLNPVTARKVSGIPAKISNGPLTGHCLMLPAEGDPVLAEGPEDGFSLWQEVCRPVLIAFGGIGKVVDLVPGGSVTIARDGDLPGSKADRALAKACDVLVERGRTVSVTATPEGKDANKIHLEQGGQALRDLVAGATRWREVLAPQPSPSATGWQPAPGDLTAAAGALTRESPPETITALLGQIIQAKLDPIQQRAILETMKSKTGMSIDVLTKGMQAVRRQAVATRDGFADICRRYVYVKTTDCFWDRVAAEMVPLQAVRNYHWRDMPAGEAGKVNPLELMLQDEHHGCDRVDAVTFLPNGPLIIEPDGPDGVRQLNMWTPPDLKPEPGDVKPLVDHVWYLLDQDPVAVNYYLDYMAHLVQRPDIKMHSCILVIGGQGIGKSTVYNMMQHLLGRKNCTAVRQSDLQSQFNEWIEAKQLVIVHELRQLQRQGLAEDLKTYITDPTIRINSKGLRTYDYENRANFLMASNHRDAAEIDDDDRRFFIWHSKAQKKPKEYFNTLYGWFDAGGCRHMLHYLLNRPLTNFNPYAEPPMTEAKAQIIQESRGSIEGYLHEAFETRNAPFQHDLVNVTDVVDFLVKEKKINISHKKVTLFLRSIEAELLGSKRIDNGRRQVKIWAIRDQASWAEAPESVIDYSFRSPWAAS